MQPSRLQLVFGSLDRGVVHACELPAYIREEVLADLLFGQTPVAGTKNIERALKRLIVGSCHPFVGEMTGDLLQDVLLFWGQVAVLGFGAGVISSSDMRLAPSDLEFQGAKGPERRGLIDVHKPLRPSDLAPGA